MLADMEMLFFAIFLFMSFVLGGVELQGMVGYWGNVQNLAQSVAMIDGKSGGYTTTAENVVDQFCRQQNKNRSDVRVKLTPGASPLEFGTPVEVAIEAPYTFEIGSFITLFTVPVTGVGRSASSYVPGALNVTYTSP